MFEINHVWDFAVLKLGRPLARPPGPMLRRKCVGPAQALSQAQAQGPGPHFLLNIGPGGRASGRLSSKTAKSQTFISNMVYRLLIFCCTLHSGLAERVHQCAFCEGGPVKVVGVVSKES